MRLDYFMLEKRMRELCNQYYPDEPCEPNGGIVKPDDYCSRGERKEANT